MTLHLKGAEGEDVVRCAKARGRVRIDVGVGRLHGVPLVHLDGRNRRAHVTARAAQPQALVTYNSDTFGCMI